MTITIDKARAIELLEQAVAERGEDFTYEPRVRDGQDTCVYVYEDQPDCLVALALNKAGVSIRDLWVYGDHGGAVDEDGEPTDDAIVAGATGLCRNLNVAGVADITDEAVIVFANAQSVQDDGLTWGEAISAARGEDDTD